MEQQAQTCRLCLMRECTPAAADPSSQTLHALPLGRPPGPCLAPRRLSRQVSLCLSRLLCLCITQNTPSVRLGLGAPALLSIILAVCHIPLQGDVVFGSQSLHPAGVSKLLRCILCLARQPGACRCLQTAPTPKQRLWTVLPAGGLARSNVLLSSMQTGRQIQVTARGGVL